MGARILKLLMAAGLMSLLAACASVGEGGRPGASMIRPVVNDPAPFVSGTMRPYQIRGQWYRPAEQPGYDERGTA
jgi:rare lipoprotein A